MKLPLAANVEPVSCKSYKSPRLVLLVTLFAGLLVLYPYLVSSHRPLHANHVVNIGDVCPQVDPLLPASAANRELAEQLDIVFSDLEFEAIAAEYLGGAVRIPTVMYDEMGPVGTDPRWDIFHEFSEHLQKTFPKVHTTLNLTRINTHALLYYWPGSDSSLKPILLTAHQDVVPVEPRTVGSWIYPPYSGHYDGTWVWGRGSVDAKSNLVGIMVALEKLIESGFEPRRGVLVGFGMDEEIGGRQGAQHIAQYIEEHYGENSISILIDEGEGFRTVDGVQIAKPGITEKGISKIYIDVATPGGHSSVPPEHTSIGILASLIVKIEATPDAPRLTRSSPVYSLLQCFAAHVPSVPPSFRSSILGSICPPDAPMGGHRRCDQALKDVESALFDASSEWNHGSEFAARQYRSLLSTTQAVDVINGGIKSNALPESAIAIIDNRIRTDSSISELQESIISRLLPLAHQFALSLTAFSQTNLTTGKAGTLTLSGKGRDPAPIAPIVGTEAAAYKLLSGVIRHTAGDKNMIVGPAIISANTDTRHYWRVTPNIFRYSHNSDEGIRGFHTVNEAIRASDLVQVVQFFKNFILTADDSVDL